VAHWTLADIPAQNGRSAVITGTGGLGFEEALALTQAGGDVTIAGRNVAKGAEAVARIKASVPNGIVRFEQMNLADLHSVADFAARFSAGRKTLDILINNAAVMAPPQRQETPDGFELQFGTNHLGHFALTGHLLRLLRAGDRARVVTVSSISNRNGVINFDDLQAKRAYKPMTVYGQSKLANMMFALELQRRSEAGVWGITSIAAHPGISLTELIPNGAGHASPLGVMRLVLGSLLFQSPAQGALPTLYAATSPEAKGGAYYGPHRMSEIRGAPAPAKIPAQANDIKAAARLWDVSEQLTGVRFDATEQAPISRLIAATG
jgi:NAD(P)-dependent dehydrogenase (short-subunit alcohol dehydrogenase family)